MGWKEHLYVVCVTLLGQLTSGGGMTRIGCWLLAISAACAYQLRADQEKGLYHSWLCLRPLEILKITSYLCTYRKAQGPCFGNREKVQRTRAVQFSLESGFGGFHVQGLKRKMFLSWNATYILYGFLNVGNLCFWVPFLPGDTNSVCLNALCMVTSFLDQSKSSALG